MGSLPNFVEEEALLEQGYRCVAGVDEVGRGPLAGPVIAAAVVLATPNGATWLTRIRDSKVLSAKARESLYPEIWDNSRAVGVGSVSPDDIDRVGIAEATRLAMISAIEGLLPAADCLLVDGLEVARLSLPQKALIRGDSICLSIAAASIVAKVTRDRVMTEMDGLYPGYGFAQHKGYGSPSHLEALRRLGPSSIHRRSFAPLRYERL